MPWLLWDNEPLLTIYLPLELRGPAMTPTRLGDLIPPWECSRVATSGWLRQHRSGVEPRAARDRSI